MPSGSSRSKVTGMSFTKAPVRDPDAVLGLLEQRGVDVVTWQGWRAIERAEARLGRSLGRARSKITDRAELLRAAADGLAGSGSPFASALVVRLKENPRLEFRDVLSLVAEDVDRITGGLARARLPHGRPHHGGGSGGLPLRGWG